jgi:hypothetical protein
MDTHAVIDFAAEIRSALQHENFPAHKATGVYAI